MDSRKNSSEEIDIVYFFRPVLQVLKRISKAFKCYIHKLQVSRVPVIVIICIVSGLGFSARYFIPKYYRTSAVFVSYNLPSSFCSEMVNSLSYLVAKRENTSVLADQLKIPITSASAIRAMYTEPMDSLLFIDKKDTTASAFRITLVLRNVDSITVIQQGLESFLENNEFSLRRKEARRATLEALRNDLIERIKSLDSLKGILNESVVPRSNGQGIIMGEPISPISAYQVQHDYYAQQKQIEEQLSLLQNVEVVQPFLKSNVSNSPNFNEILVYSILAGFIISLIFVIFKR